MHSLGVILIIFLMVVGVPSEIKAQDPIESCPNKLILGLNGPTNEKIKKLYPNPSLRFIPVPWKTIQPSQDSALDFSAIDNDISSAIADGQTPAVKFCDGDCFPDWARQMDQAVEGYCCSNDYVCRVLKDDETTVNAFENVVRAMVSRYKDRISQWDYGIEPNCRGYTPERYTRWLGYFSRAVRSADPSAVVVGGHLSGADTNYLQAMYDFGAGSYFDRVALDPYGEPLNIGGLESIYNLMVQKGDGQKKIWIGEWGIATNNDEARQASLIEQGLNYLASKPFIEAAFYHNYECEMWAATCSPGTPGYLGFGLLRGDGTEKAAYQVFQRAAAFCSGSSPGPSTSLSPSPSASPSLSPSSSPSPTPIPTSTPSPAPPPITTTSFRMAENPTDLSSAPWQDYTADGMAVDFEFRDKTPGQKSVFVEFKGSDGRVERRAAQVKLLGPDPTVTSCALSFEGVNTILSLTGQNFADRGIVKGGDTDLQVREWKNSNIKAVWPNAPEGQILSVTATNSDGQVAEGQCSVISQLSVGAKFFCRAPSTHNVNNVDLVLVGAFEGGIRVRQKVNIDKEGFVQGLTQKLEEGKDYKLSLKAPRSLRKAVSFTAGDGTTNIPNFLLPVGDVFPADGGDGKINTLDKGELNRQWVIAKDVTGRSADFNRDSRVNSFDWACMRYDFNSEDDLESAAGGG